MSKASKNLDFCWNSPVVLTNVLEYRSQHLKGLCKCACNVHPPAQVGETRGLDSWLKMLNLFPPSYETSKYGVYTVW